MKKIHIIIALFCLCGLSVLTNSCQKKNADLRLVTGTLDEALPADTAPQNVQDAIVKAVKVHPFEIMNDEANSISVVGIGEAETTSTEGYGIMITKGAVSTTFPNIRNVRQPVARYDSATGNLWLTSSAMEGSGVRVEWLYQIRFGDNDLAYVAAVLNPFDVQQALCQRYAARADTDQADAFQAVISFDDLVSDTLQRSVDVLSGHQCSLILHSYLKSDGTCRWYFTTICAVALSQSAFAYGSASWESLAWVLFANQRSPTAPLLGQHLNKYHTGKAGGFITALKGHSTSTPLKRYRRS